MDKNIIVLPSQSSQLLNLILAGALRSEMVPRFPFLKDAPKRMCRCKHPAFEQLDVLLHLWDNHVNGARDWSKKRLNGWLKSIDTPRA